MRTTDREPSDPSASWESFVSAILRAHAAELAAKRRHPDSSIGVTVQECEPESADLNAAISLIPSRPAAVS